MIKKLQRKFIMITMGSLALVIAILLGSINAINLYQMEKKINGAMDLLIENQGRFPQFERKKPPQMEPRSGFKMDEETPFETRYFVVEVNEDGTIRTIDTSHIAAVSSEDAKEYGNKVIESGKKKGYKGIYKYAVGEQSYGSIIIFVNCKNQIQTAMLFLITSVIVALINYLLVFILVYIFSKKAIKPVIESMEKQKQFITDAGHEIKTPLAIISANTDVLELTSGENEWITSIRNQTNRLDKLVKNLLILSKMDEANVNMEMKTFKLSQMVQEAADSFEAIAETQNKKYIMDIQPGIDFYGDESSIHQLVSTLLDNAMKYSDEEGTIRISLTSSKKRIQLEVYNTTEIIEKENLNKLFDRFYRADFSRSRETGGYGIGLSIVDSIVKIHHGKITVKSTDEKSISFTVILSN
ncbi:histidine kinase [Mobilisporobacter senegalensis]|uniref:histidine kinase n=1 Tax=Mobilisporobacter senegalensis TaxID=1329262 RepID=A0A3N1XTH8_9FIRM|nr:HAMP domain-containing sensor histidine kinase [Mobilisporobacter senegalensis]ROR28472.1 histidine kinase [Mobilisporobacter senegalensis]